MTIERQTVYIETSIVSYLTARPSRDILVLARQDLTREWWSKQRFNYRLFASPPVIEEARRGNASAAARRVEMLSQVELLDWTADLDALAPIVQRILQIPHRARFDALHLACAIHYGIDYLLTWNCTHLANAEVQRRLARFCHTEGRWLPIICTPETLLGEREMREDV